jgi:hypothetical protein
MAGRAILKTAPLIPPTKLELTPLNRTRGGLGQDVLPG